jgi:hypothetical protein
LQGWLLKPIDTFFGERRVEAGAACLRKTMDRQQAHQLLDQLGRAQFDAVAKLLEVMIGDENDEELTAEDRRAVAASRDYFRQNPEGGIPFEQVVAECGFTMDQVRHQGG